MASETKWIGERWEVWGRDPLHDYQIVVRTHDGVYVAACGHGDRASERADFIASAPALYAALEAVEWVECEAGMVRVCPWCKHSETTGHAADCEREAALAQARGEGA